MNLVNELQQSAEDDDVLKVLRKATRLAGKLSLTDISSWLSHEQNGYPDGVDVPNYRIMRTELCYRTNGYVRADARFLVNGILPYPIELHQEVAYRASIAEVLAIIGSRGSSDVGPYSAIVDDDLTEFLQKPFPGGLGRQFSYFLKFNHIQIAAIPDAIKNKVLEWAIQLEQRGVLGEGLSFKETEVQAAQQVSYNFWHSTVGQVNNSGTNLTGGDLGRV